MTRFASADRLCSWAGLTPKHRESDTKVRRGSISKQGSRLLRWAAVEAASKNHAGGDFKEAYRRIAERRGRNVAKIAAARKLLTLVFYGMNAKLVFEATLNRDAHGSGIYVRAEHRRHGPRRPRLQSLVSTTQDRTVW